MACQVPLSMGFSRQEYWRGLPCPYPGDLPDSGIEPGSLNVSYIGKQVFITSAEKPIIIVTFFFIIYVIYLGLHRIFASCCARAFSCRGFSCCGARAQYLRCMGLVTLRHVESLQTRD